MSHCTLQGSASWWAGNVQTMLSRISVFQYAVHVFRSWKKIRNVYISRECTMRYLGSYQSVNQLINQSINQSNNRTINQSINQSMNDRSQSINQLINGPITINQSMDRSRSINQLIERSVEKTYYSKPFFFASWRDGRGFRLLLCTQSLIRIRKIAGDERECRRMSRHGNTHTKIGRTACCSTSAWAAIAAAGCWTARFILRGNWGRKSHGL